MKFIDCHTHAHFAAFKDDWRDVIERSLKNDVWVVNVGTQKDTSAKAIEVAHEFEDLPAEAGEPAKAGGVYATVGLHPIHTSKSFHDAQELGLPSVVSTEEGDTENAKGFTSRGEEFDPVAYLKLARDPKVVAIGECGLDYYRIEEGGKGEEESAKNKQKRAFIQQIELAKEIKKPLMIHCREAFPNLIELLKANSSKLKANASGIIHFFSGTPADAKQLLDFGFSFTFGGVITFARNYDEVIKMLPLDRILSETDAPYVTPAPYRGQRNEPVYVIEVVKKLAELKQVSVEEMAEQIFENAKRIFGIQ